MMQWFCDLIKVENHWSIKTLQRKNRTVYTYIVWASGQIGFKLHLLILLSSIEYPVTQNFDDIYEYSKVNYVFLGCNSDTFIQNKGEKRFLLRLKGCQTNTMDVLSLLRMYIRQCPAFAWFFRNLQVYVICIWNFIRGCNILPKIGRPEQ